MGARFVALRDGSHVSVANKHAMSTSAIPIGDTQNKGIDIKWGPKLRGGEERRNQMHQGDPNRPAQTAKAQPNAPHRHDPNKYAPKSLWVAKFKVFCALGHKHSKLHETSI